MEVDSFSSFVGGKTTDKTFVPAIEVMKSWIFIAGPFKYLNGFMLVTRTILSYYQYYYYYIFFCYRLTNVPHIIIIWQWLFHYGNGMLDVVYCLRYTWYTTFLELTLLLIIRIVNIMAGVKSSLEMSWMLNIPQRKDSNVYSCIIYVYTYNYFGFFWSVIRYLQPIINFVIVFLDSFRHVARIWSVRLILLRERWMLVYTTVRFQP